MKKKNGGNEKKGHSGKPGGSSRSFPRVPYVRICRSNNRCPTWSACPVKCIGRPCSIEIELVEAATASMPEKTPYFTKAAAMMLFLGAYRTMQKPARARWTVQDLGALTSSLSSAVGMIERRKKDADGATWLSELLREEGKR